MTLRNKNEVNKWDYDINNKAIYMTSLYCGGAFRVDKQKGYFYGVIGRFPSKLLQHSEKTHSANFLLILGYQSHQITFQSMVLHLSLQFILTFLLHSFHSTPFSKFYS